MADESHDRSHSAGREEHATPLAGVHSPRIAALERQLAAGEAGDPGALEPFWREVAAAGTPLIEPLPGDDAYALVTFLWREGRHPSGPDSSAPLQLHDAGRERRR